MNLLKPAVALAVLVVWCLLVPASGRAQEVLTNDAVIAMKKAGLSDAVILAKIRSSQTKFSVTTEGLVALKQAGLSDQIIEAMVTHPGLAGSPPPAATAPAAPGGAVAATGLARDTIFHLSGDRYVELTPAGASIETNFAFFTSKSELVMKGRKASYRVPDRQPVFATVYAPADVPLVRLKPGDDNDDRNLKISSGSFMPFGGSHRQGVRSEDTIEVETEKDPRGFYRIKPRAELPPGEYGFILTHGFAAGASGKVYDFGVD